MTDNRRQMILDLLQKEEYLSTDKCCELFSGSKATIRRDFNALANAGLVKRIHGGIRNVSDNRSPILPFAVRGNVNSAEKHLLCRYAAGMIKPGMTVMIYGGTTMAEFGDYLKDGVVITNLPVLAFRLMERFSTGGGPEMILTGGKLDLQNGTIQGTRACEFVSRYECDIGFFSAYGCDENGLTEISDESRAMQEIMLRHSRKRVLLMDHEKFHRKGICRSASWDQIDLLLTQSCKENAPVLQAIREKNVRIQILNPAS